MMLAWKLGLFSGEITQQIEKVYGDGRYDHQVCNPLVDPLTEDYLYNAIESHGIKSN